MSIEISAAKLSFPRLSFARDVGRALASPHRTWSFLRRWALLAQHSALPCAQLKGYRRELFEDGPFQAHLQRCCSAIRYVFHEAVELYSIVRGIKPEVMVETGVASGLSSSHILRALDANGMGMLHSVDLPNVQEGSVLPQGRTSGWIVPEALRGRWKLHIGDARKILPDLFESLGEIDIFLHDSDHSYENMIFELEQAFPRVRDGGLLLSDDSHLHRAWDDFCLAHGLRPTRVGRLGILRKPKNPAGEFSRRSGRTLDLSSADEKRVCL